MIAIPLAVSQIDLANFAKLAKEDLGRSITKTGDVAGLKGMPAAIAALSSFDDNAASFVVSLSFYVTGHFDLSIPIRIISSKNKEAMILTGNLYEWKYSIVLACSKTQSSRDIRLVFNEIFSFFCQIGLRDVWSDYEREDNHDGTYFLKSRS